MANEIEKFNGEIIIYQSEDGKINLVSGWRRKQYG